MAEVHRLARLLGGDVAGANAVVAPGPRHSVSDRSLSVRFGDGPEGFVVFSHAGDDPLECRDYVRDRLGLKAWAPTGGDRKSDQVADIATRSFAAETAAKLSAVDPKQQQNIDWALKLWDEASDPRGTVVETYLRSRGLELDELVLDAIRFHPRLRYTDGYMPGMVGLYRDLVTDEPSGAHRTFLSPDGKKIGRKMLGRAGGAAIKLDPDAEVTMGLAIAEGIETAMAARILGFRPTWALGSAGGIETFPILAIESLTLLAETDDGGANERAVVACTGRWLGAGRQVVVVTPRMTGDMNDVLRKARG